VSDEGPWDGRLFGSEQRCFGCGVNHPHGFHLTFRRDGDEAVTEMTPGHDHQGAPGMMHGGLIATLADEIAVWTLILQAGKFGFTTSFGAKYRRATRIGVPVEARGRLLSRPRRLVDISVIIRQEGEVCFEGDFKFAILDRAGAERLMGTAMPDDWARFSR
jgi:uncharacterized protein (TIGR00369 family)